MMMAAPDDNPDTVLQQNREKSVTEMRCTKMGFANDVSRRQPLYLATVVARHTVVKTPQGGCKKII